MTLRQLSVMYLAAASSFAVAIAITQHPDLGQSAQTNARSAAAQSVAAVGALNDYAIRPGLWFAETASVAMFRDAENLLSAPPHVAPRMSLADSKPEPRRIAAQSGQRVTDVSAPVVSQLRPPILEAAPATLQPRTKVASAMSPTSRQVTLAPQAMSPSVPPNPNGGTSALPPDHPPTAAQIAAVTRHVQSTLTGEMLANFDLVLFVSKAQGSAIAQRMYVFQKQNGNELSLLHSWPVSTGREKVEFAPNGTKQPSFTPEGYYEFDASRMYVHHFSGQWRQPMPYAMFFNWENHGYRTGLAIHGATGDDIGLLGSRASAGCVRLAPENAHTLFSLIKNYYKGLMPKFAYDKRTATMSNDGVMLHTDDGRLEMTEGYKVLVFIENYGGKNVVAEMF